MNDLFTSTEATTQFVGWARLPHQRKWHRVTTGETRFEALAQLLAIRPPGKSRDLIVLEAHQDPNEERKPR